jgi:hypothetical protein
MRPIDEIEFYKIIPRYKRKWFIMIKVYDLFVIKRGLVWIDCSFGNGGGEFDEYEIRTKINTFNSYIEADKFKDELEGNFENS